MISFFTSRPPLHGRSELKIVFLAQAEHLWKDNAGDSMQCYFTLNCVHPVVYTGIYYHIKLII